MRSPGNHKQQQNTSWGAVADWYSEHLSGDDTYHAQVIAPNIVRLVAAAKPTRVLDIGCGEGYFTRLFAEKFEHVEGADIAQELITTAQKQSLAIKYHVASADDLTFADDQSYDVVTCVLALQNMERIEPVFKECARVLTDRGRFIFVLNHPTFRINGSSSWGWDEESHIQYRRVEKYLSATRSKIDMHPGKEGSKEYTYSFHRSMQDYSKALAGAGFAIVKIEEWISHRASEKGPRAEAENSARKEIPLFMCIEARPLIN